MVLATRMLGRVGGVLRGPPMTDFESYAERVRAALAEQRALAQAAPLSPWSYGDVDSVAGGSIYDCDIMIASLFWDTERVDPRIRRTISTDQADAAGVFIAANDPAHVLELIDKQETAVGLAVEGLRRHANLGSRACSHCADQWWPCLDALAWWSVLTGIGATYGVTPPYEHPAGDTLPAEAAEPDLSRGIETVVRDGSVLSPEAHRRVREMLDDGKPTTVRDTEPYGPTS
jgi:hypothetical protein